MKRRDLGITGFNIAVFVLLLLSFFFVPTERCFAADGDLIIKYATPDKAGKLLIIGGDISGRNVAPPPQIKYKVTKLDNPPRMVVDIKNAVLSGGKKSIRLNNSKLTQDIRIAQFESNPNIVRIVFTAASEDALKGIKINAYKNNIVFEFDNVALTKAPASSVYNDRALVELNKPLPEETEAAEKAKNIQQSSHPTPEKDETIIMIEGSNVTKQKVGMDQLKNVITPDEKTNTLRELRENEDHNIVIKSIRQDGNRLLISGAGIMSVVEPFTLDTPNRKIFDITSAVLDSALLIGEVPLKNGDVARIAQFDPQTVRIVIESTKPDSYTTVFSPDLQSIVISPDKDVSFAEFPDNNSFGAVKHIEVIKANDNTTKVVITSEKPIIHNIDRLYSPDRLILSLYNIKKPDTGLIDGLKTTGQYHGCSVSSVDEFPNGSRWRFPLNKSTMISSKLSLDGRVLEVTMHDSTYMVLGTSSKIKRRIVIDPGHGGTDPGAQRRGYNEKDINLDVAMRVKRHLANAGFYVVMTRETDKTVSLQERVDICNRVNPDVFLSVHSNASNNPGLTGIETYWYAESSRPFASYISNQLGKHVDAINRGLKNARFFVLRHTKCPAVLAEIGYMSNERELYRMVTEERKEATARALAEGIIEYLKAKSTGTVKPCR